METVYRSKTDLWLVALLALAMIASLSGAFVVLSMGPSAAWVVAAFIAIVGVGLPVWLLLSTRYILGQGQLRILSGPFKWCIPVAKITTIAPASSPISSPALSLDRLRIDYGVGNSVMISPRDKEQFVKDIEAARAGAV
ncbi:PH domain-containing protein [Dyella sp.]|jgi:hypothetical protein|uniref:PH domain-containing protein n=1 Tax=Dyella sp. TaxID=1869338 RepID=UPI002D77DAC2|nr:PH domain-containing protein [Dyella sp.]HET6431103.1 PH domain-containing protein [Dyella sp.]